MLALDQAVASTGSERAGSKLLIILDQFEEYFLYRARERRVERFADELAECINQPDLPANFLISIREDAYSALGDLLRGRITNVYSNYLHLDYLNEQAAREAIEGPIAYFNSSRPKSERMTIEPGLVEAVLEQVKRDPEDPAINGEGPAPTPKTNRVEIATPYLQLVMTALWNRERSEGSSVLRLSTLQDLHGAESMVAQHLNDALGTLGTEDRELAVDVLHHLVTPSGTKVALEVADLSAYTRYPSTRVAEVLKDLAGPDRILREVPPAPGKGGDDDNSRRFEIYHDVLAGPINNAVAETATRRLEKEKAEAERRVREEQKRVRTFRGVAIAAVVLLLGAIAAFVVAEVQSHRAHTAEQSSRSGELAAQAQAGFLSGDLARGVQLSAQAYRTRPISDAQAAVTTAMEDTQDMVAYLSGQTGVISGVAYSPDGATLASTSDTGNVVLWNTTTAHREAVLTGNPGQMTSVSFSPDGSMLATSDDSGHVILWDPRSHQRLRVLSSSDAAIETVTFAHTGELLATAQASGKVDIWNSRSGLLVRTLDVGSQPVFGVAFTPDGKVVVAGGQDGHVSFWSAVTGRRLRVFSVGKGVNSLAINAAGTTLAVAAGSQVLLYDVRSGNARRILHVNSGLVLTAAFAADGRTLAAGSAGSNQSPPTVTVWDSGSGRLLKLLSAPSAISSIYSVAFNPTRLAVASGGASTAGSDPSLIVWNAQPAPGFRVLRGPTGPINAVAYSPSGTQVAATGADGTVIVWNLGNGAARTLALNAPGESVAFSPDGRTLAAGADDRTVTLWNVATGRKLRVLRGHSAAVLSIAFSPDGKLLASGSADQKVFIWNVSTGRPVRELGGHTDHVNAVAFSPDGKLLASAGADDVINLWDVAAGRRDHVLRASRPVGAVAFSTDGQTLATAGADELVSLWHVSTGDLAGHPFAGHQDNITSLAFGSNPSQLVSGSGDHSVLVWDLKTGLGVPIGGHTGGVTSVAVSPDGRTVASGGADSTVTLESVPAAADSGAIQRLCSIFQRTC